VERGEHEVTRLGRGHGQLGRFLVAHLAYEHDIRILPHATIGSHLET